MLSVNPIFFDTEGTCCRCLMLVDGPLLLFDIVFKDSTALLVDESEMPEDSFFFFSRMRLK